MGFEKYGVIVIVALILGTAYYLFYFDKGTGNAAAITEYAKKAEPVNTSTCIDGTNQTCNAGKCDGVRVCKNGKLGNCFVIKNCVPGAKISCGPHGCATGYKTCNECGTGYGECVEPD